MRFSLTTLALSILSISAFAAPSASTSSSEVELESNSTLESRTFFHNCPANTNWKLTKCCPWDSWEVPLKFRCECSTPGKTLSADGRSCENKCSGSGWKWCNTQCCPAGSDEVNGKCVCSGGKQLVGTGSNKQCVAQCPTGQYFAKTKCCPSSSSEQWDKSCKCDSSNQKLSDDKTKCIDKCPAGWNACASQCCPPGSSEKHGQCVCDDLKKTLKGSGDSRKCEYNCATGCSFKDSICCPSDSFEMHGKCQCNDPSKAPNSDNTKCVSKCTKAGEKYTNGVCCKSYLTGQSGKCVCPTNGQIDDGYKCSACPAGQNYNWITRGCDAPCTKDGTSYKVTRRGKGVCCRSGHTACETVCCPSGTDEVGTTGKCCTKPITSLDSYGNCLVPSHVPRAIKRNGPAEIQLEAPSTYFGLNGNANNALCPARTAACPIEGRGDDDYECIDTTSDLQSCGGCASLGEGIDCTLIKGAKWMGCVKGQCEVYSCGKGFKLVDGSCKKA